MDGVLSNPFAHAVATALRIDGSTRVEDVLTVETDLFRANNISSDDTSTVRVTTRRGTTLLFAATLCSPVVDTPEVIVGGTSATATLRYTSDEIGVTDPAGELLPSELTGSYGRDNLLANLIEHRGNPAVPLIADVRETGAFTAVLEALRLAPEPAAIPQSLLRMAGRTNTAGMRWLPTCGTGSASRQSAVRPSPNWVRRGPVLPMMRSSHRPRAGTPRESSRGSNCASAR